MIFKRGDIIISDKFKDAGEREIVEAHKTFYVWRFVDVVTDELFDSRNSNDRLLDFWTKKDKK